MKFLMENLINKYPEISSDFSQLIKFSFNKTLKYFNQKIRKFKTEYFFLINVNKSLFIQNDNKNLKLIDDIIKVLNELKKNYRVKIFSYKKYVKEIIKVKKDNENIEPRTIIDLLLNEIEESPQSDIILSLSDLYTKIEKYLIREENEKNRIMKIIIINNEEDDYNQKKFEQKTLEKILTEFINDKSCFYGVELFYLNNDILTNKSIPEIFNKNDALLKKQENINIEIYDKWQDIFSNEYINDGIKKLDDLIKFFKNVLNSIFFIKNKIKKSKDEKIKQKQMEKLETYINSNNINNIKEGIISSEINESYMEELNNFRNNLKEIEKEINEIINEEKMNQNENSIFYMNEISKYLLEQKDLFLKFIQILEKSLIFIDSIEKEIFNQKKNINNNSNDNDNNNSYNNIYSEKSEEENENEEEEI